MLEDDRPRPRRKTGPKPIAPADRRKHSISCRVTDAELVTLDARRGAVSRGEWLRLAALSKPPRIIPEVNREAWAALARLAANLNQIAKRMNEVRTATPSDLHPTIRALHVAVQALRADLLGVRPVSEEDRP